MLSLALILFLSGVLTILLPCILPLLPIVLGVSVAGRNKLRPLLTVFGMLVSFVGFTFLLQVVLSQFVEFADYMRIATFYILLLFGLGFAFHSRAIHVVGAVLGALFFWDKGLISMIAVAILGVIAMEVGGRVASRIQQLGSDVQTSATNELGADSPLTAFIIGLTLGLVWVPCAGPALGFALTLVREQPGLQALMLLTAYGLGTAIPLLIVGYGGQATVHSVRSINKYSGTIKQVAGVVLILTAIALRFDAFMKLQTFLIETTGYGNFASRFEETLFKGSQSSSPSDSDMYLPKISRAPELASAGPWHNLPAGRQDSEPLKMADLRGKVVLVDFWTYSCINCIRTLPYIRGYWDKYRDTEKFVLLGVHTPEFVFEKSEANVKKAISKHKLTYPIVQDNDFGTWRAFDNHYWPAKYLIDAEGYIRYTHFGEGAYEETDMAIASLLEEAGVEMPGSGPGSGKESESVRRSQSAETYLGSRSWPALGNKQGEPSDEIITYTAPPSMKLHQYYLVGEWQLMDDERQTLVSDTGEIRMQWLGSEINLVLGLAEGAKPVQAEVWIDDKKVKDFTVDVHDLYELYKGEYGEHELVLKLKGKGVEGYAFTFGSD